MKSGCNACARDVLSMDDAVAAGFGSAGYSQDGITLWQEGEPWNGKPHPTVRDIEALAAKEPDHDWRLFFFGAMWTTEYQRQGDGRWVLISRAQGFA